MFAEQIAERTAIRATPAFSCAGVNWGVYWAEQLLQEHGTIYIPNKNGLVHYDPVTQRLEQLGARFVSDPREIPEGGVVANSMHGLSPEDVKIFIEKRLLHYDLRCFLVTQVGERVLEAIDVASKVGKLAKILYACKDVTHPEPKAILDLAPNHVVPVADRSVLEEYEVREDEMYYLDSQTTINVQKSEAMIEEYRWKFPGLKSLRGMLRMGACFATDNRQQAIDALLEAAVDKVVVIGSRTSANTTQLFEICRARGVDVEFPLRASDLKGEMFDGFNRIGVSGGASVPPEEGDRAMEMFQKWGFRTDNVVVGKPEPRTFNLKPPVYDYRSGQITTEMLELTLTY